MLSLNRQTVNVDRLALIAALENGLEQHCAQYEEAVGDYEEAVKQFLTDALARTTQGDFTDVHLKLEAPVSRTQQYVDAIDMLSVSVDATIQLDTETYKAYYRNEWPWSRDFLEAAASYKSFDSIGGALGH